MIKQGQTKALTCTADGYIYQITADERNLYFNKVGREGADNDGTMMGSMRVVKSQVEAVRCVRVRGKTVILVVFEGKTSRLEVQGSVKEELLMKIFGGVPLKLSISRHSNVLTEQYELRLLAACFIVTILRVLCYFMKEIEWLAPYVVLGWIAIPFFWLIPCAGRMLKSGLRDQFPVGAGMLASVFSCIFLWGSSARGVENWLALLLPSVIIAAAVGVVYFFARRKAVFRDVAVVVLVALLCFAPAATLGLNRMLPAWSVETKTAEVVALNTSYKYGNHHYYATLDAEGAQSSVKLRPDDYASLEQGEHVDIVRTTGLLGLTYTQVDCK